MSCCYGLAWCEFSQGQFAAAVSTLAPLLAQASSPSGTLRPELAEATLELAVWSQVRAKDRDGLFQQACAIASFKAFQWRAAPSIPSLPAPALSQSDNRFAIGSECDASELLFIALRSLLGRLVGLLALLARGRCFLDELFKVRNRFGRFLRRDERPLDAAAGRINNAQRCR